MTSPTRRRLLAMSAAAVALAVAGCSSSSKPASTVGGPTSPSTSTAPATSAAATTSGAPTTSAAGPLSVAPSAITAATTAAVAPAGSSKLTVTGAVVATVIEGTNPSAVQCHVDATGSASNIIDFDGPLASYDLQMGVPAGTTTFPDASGKSGIFFYDGDNSKLEWGASGTAQGGTGTVTRSADNKTGTLDVQMTSAAPPGSPKLPPIHVSGSWTC